MNRMHIFLPLIFLALTAVTSSKEAVYAEGLSQYKAVAAQQLKSLEPDEQDLQGFVRFRPAEPEMLKGYSKDQNQGTQSEPPPVVPILDRVQLDVAPERHTVALDVSGHPIPPTLDRNVSTIVRGFLSANGLYTLNVSVTICASEQFAEEELHYSYDGSQLLWRQLSAVDGAQIGDEAWTPATGRWADLAVRCGRIVVVIRGDISFVAMKNGVTAADFPAEAVKAVAYQVLLRASQQPGLTGVSVQQAHVDVSGHALPKNALLVAGQTYVPVSEFAKAMGLTSRWNDKSGTLTLNGAGRKAVTLTAGSTAAIVGGAKAADLSVPVLKQNGQPVMTLTDLLAVTGGRVVGRSGDTVEVKG